MASSRLGERKSSIMAQRNKLTGILNTLQRKKSNNFRGGEKMRVTKGETAAERNREYRCRITLIITPRKI